MILFAVRAKGVDEGANLRLKTTYCLVWEIDREAAKKAAAPHMSRLRGDSDDWDVIPITEENAIVHLCLPLGME